MALPPDDRLAAHLRAHLGQWPPRGRLDVIGHPARLEPMWDGRIRHVAGVATPEGTVLSVPPAHVEAVAALGEDWAAPDYTDALNDVFGFAGEQRHVLDGTGVFRFSTAPTPGADAGEWVSVDDPRTPPWLRPFNGGVLIAWDDEGGYGAGVGVKHHDAWGEELAVGTEPSLRGRGLGRLLVATAAREVLRRGRVPIYLHAPDNHASAHVADAAGFPDRGWKVLGFWRRQPA